MIQRETVFYVVLEPDERILSKYFESDRAQRFAEHYNLMDRALTARVVRVDFIRQTAGRPHVQSP